MSLCFFSTSGEATLQTHSWKFTPLPSLPFAPPPPPSISLQFHKRHMHSVLALKVRNSMLFGDEQRGGGVDFDKILSICCCILETKNPQLPNSGRWIMSSLDFTPPKWRQQSSTRMKRFLSSLQPSYERLCELVLCWWEPGKTHAKLAN